MGKVGRCVQMELNWGLRPFRLPEYSPSPFPVNENFAHSPFYAKNPSSPLYLARSRVFGAVAMCSASVIRTIL